MADSGTFWRDSAKEALSPEDDFLITFRDASHNSQSSLLELNFRLGSGIEPPGHLATIK